MPQWLLRLDGGLLLWLQGHVRCPALDAVLIPFTTLGNAGLLWIALSVALLCFRRTRRLGLLSLLALLIGALITNLALKPWAARPRPWLSVEGLVPLVSPGDPYSFPSGHTTAAFAATGIWRRMTPLRRRRALLLLSALLMAFSRLYVGVHFPTDVLGGLCAGQLASWLVWRGQLAWQARRAGGKGRPRPRS